MRHRYATRGPCHVPLIPEVRTLEDSARERPESGGPHDGYQCGRAWVALRTAYAQVTACLNAALGARFGLGVNDFEVLLLLGSAPDPLRLGELNRAAALSQPALSRLVTRLEARGLVARAETPDDRRAILIGITAQGQETLREAIPVHAACVRGGFIDRLSEPEQEALVALLARAGPAGDRNLD